VSLGGIVGLALVMVVSLGIGHALGGPAPWFLLRRTTGTW